MQRGTRYLVTQPKDYSPHLLAMVKSTSSSVTPSNLPVDWSDIATAQSTDPEIQELCNKAACQPNPDPSLMHYVLENGFLFRSVPDGRKGSKLQLVIPACL